MARKNNNTQAKGDFLEEVVALLHEGPGLTIERKARVPILGPERGSSEVDILVSGQIAGYKVRIAIECKNWAKKVESSQINEFIGKLRDVGIPLSHGVYVAANGYTKGAIRRAVKEGIRPLEISGLNRDRLTSATEKAFQKIVYLMPVVEQVYCANDKLEPGGPAIRSLRYESPITGRSIYVFDHLWKKWFFDECPTDLGLQHHSFDIPQDSSLFASVEEVEPRHVLVTLRVLAAVASTEGSLTSHSLTNAESKVVEKRRVSFDFGGTERRVVRLFESEEALASSLRESGSTSLVVGRVKLPRFIYKHFYWPITSSAHNIAIELKRRGEALTLKAVEGSDLSTAWDFLARPEDVEAISDDNIGYKLYS